MMVTEQSAAHHGKTCSSNGKLPFFFPFYFYFFLTLGSVCSMAIAQQVANVTAI